MLCGYIIFGDSCKCFTNSKPMNGNEIPYVGRRLKEIRLSKEMKLTDVAARAGVSKGLLSRIENSRSIPSLPVLFSVIEAVAENPVSFFERFSFTAEAPFYILMRMSDYHPIEKENSTGFHYFNIISRSFSDITFSVAHLLLDHNACRDLVTTDGMEYIYLAEGEIDYVLGKDTITMYPGDSLFFDGRLPHLKVNHSGSTARILVVYLLFNK
jgi:transcriptional regulator with XRE-family HTH domain